MRVGLWLSQIPSAQVEKNRKTRPIKNGEKRTEKERDRKVRNKGKQRRKRKRGGGREKIGSPIRGGRSGNKKSKKK